MKTANELRAGLIAQKKELELKAQKAAKSRADAKQALADLYFLGLPAAEIIKGASIDPEYLAAMYNELKLPGGQVRPQNGASKDDNAGPPWSHQQVIDELPHNAKTRFGSDRWTHVVGIDLTDDEEDFESETVIVGASSLNESVSVKAPKLTQEELRAKIQAQREKIRLKAMSIEPKTIQPEQADVVTDNNASDAVEPKRTEANVHEKEEAVAEPAPIKRKHDADAELSSPPKKKIQELQVETEKQATSQPEKSNNQVSMAIIASLAEEDPELEPETTQISTGVDPLEEEVVTIRAETYKLDAGRLPLHPSIYQSPLHIFETYRFAPLFANGDPHKVFSPTYNGSFIHNSTENYYCKNEAADGQCEVTGCAFLHYQDFVVEPSGKLAAILSQGSKDAKVKLEVAKHLKQAKKDHQELVPETVVKLLLQARQDKKLYNTNVLG